MNFKKIITCPQTCDMGSGFGKVEFKEGATLGEFLEFYKNNGNAWGVMTIRQKSGEILRLFDYDVYYGRNLFYCNLNWELKDKIKEINFRYCFMNEDVEVILE